MKPKLLGGLVLISLLAGGLAGCGRGDTRVNSDPGPGARSTTADSNVTPPSAAGKPIGIVGTDSTGRPGDASGGTTVPVGAEGSPSAPAKGTKVDLNTASPAELERLPGVGTEFANAIIASRPFKSVDDLRRVPGFSADKVRALSELTYASPVAPPAEKKADPSPTATPSRPPQLNDGKAKRG
jgi:competence ComEA-like helix-hairpin-helix protein